jgi:hypothetical protein
MEPTWNWSEPGNDYGSSGSNPLTVPAPSDSAPLTCSTESGLSPVMVRRYIRDGSLFRENSAGKLGL